MMVRKVLAVASAGPLLATMALLPETTQAQKPVSAPITVVGIVAGAPQGREFNLRLDDVQVRRVNVHSGVDISRIRGGDQVRVYGRPVGQKIYHANVRVLQQRASTVPEDYD